VWVCGAAAKRSGCKQQANNQKELVGTALRLPRSGRIFFNSGFKPIMVSANNTLSKVQGKRGQCQTCRQHLQKAMYPFKAENKLQFSVRLVLNLIKILVCQVLMIKKQLSYPEGIKHYRY